MENAPPEKQTARLEAFSDGVFAIAVTLLVLDLKVPRPETLAGSSLWQALRDEWPSYLAYTTSFLTILVMWINHHNILRYMRRSDHFFLVANGLLLMGVSVVPFSTSLLAAYLRHDNTRTAAAVYAGTYLGIALLFNLVWRYATYHDRLLDRSLNPTFVRKLTRGYLFGPFLYAMALALAVVSGIASFAVCLALAVFFALPMSADDPRST